MSPPTAVSKILYESLESFLMKLSGSTYWMSIYSWSRVGAIQDSLPQLFQIRWHKNISLTDNSQYHLRLYIQYNVDFKVWHKVALMVSILKMNLDLNSGRLWKIMLNCNMFQSRNITLFKTFFFSLRLSFSLCPLVFMLKKQQPYIVYKINKCM